MARKGLNKAGEGGEGSAIVGPGRKPKGESTHSGLKISKAELANAAEHAKMTPKAMLASFQAALGGHLAAHATTQRLKYLERLQQERDELDARIAAEKTTTDAEG